MVKVSSSIVPSFFTVGNMFCGFYSIIAAFNNKFTLAAWMIFFSAFFDAMDGKIARFTKTSSRFGIEYDSLADVISFGLAPSFLMFVIYFKDFPIIFGVLVSFLPLLFGSIRLARFNTQLKGFDKDYFVGLPIPAAALTLSSFVIFSEYYYDIPIKYPKIMLTFIFLVSLLMVSTVRYETMPKLNFKGSARNKIKFILILLACSLLLIFPQAVLFPFMIIYILSGLIIWIIHFTTGDTFFEEGRNIDSK
jgi:CDP-diacylglycerol--serine O-phosphatidyltransferase